MRAAQKRSKRKKISTSSDRTICPPHSNSFFKKLTVCCSLFIEAAGSGLVLLAETLFFLIDPNARSRSPPYKKKKHKPNVAGDVYQSLFLLLSCPTLDSIIYSVTFLGLRAARTYYYTPCPVCAHLSPLLLSLSIVVSAKRCPDKYPSDVPMNIRPTASIFKFSFFNTYKTRLSSFWPRFNRPSNQATNELL